MGCVLSQSSEEEEDGIIVPNPIRPGSNFTLVPHGSLQNETIPTGAGGNTRMGGQTPRPPTTRATCPYYFYPVYSRYRCSRICGYYGYRYYRYYGYRYTMKHMDNGPWIQIHNEAYGQWTMDTDTQ